MVSKVAWGDITMVSIVSEKHRLWALMCIFSLLRHTSASAQNTQSEEIPSLVFDSRQIEKPQDANRNQGASVFNVDVYGARGDGRSDDSKAFLAAWTAACTKTSPSVFLIPQRNVYFVDPINFNGPCKAPGLTVQISGTVIAPSNPWIVGNTVLGNKNTWLQFSNLQGLTIEGGGIIDGSGEKWWSKTCLDNPIQSCVWAPTSVLVTSSENVTVRHLTFQNSPGIHLKINGSSLVEVSDLSIVNPQYSPYTDGVNVASSQQVAIKNSVISTGDDCVTIFSGSSDIHVNNLVCRSHGISIGALGGNNASVTVSNVVYRDITLIDTLSGLRIKSWQGGSGYAQNISYENVIMNNVSNPIIIDQYYCPPYNTSACKNLTSAVQIREVSYTGIHGTSATPEAIRFACSKTFPCTNFVLKDIDITMNDGSAANSFVYSLKGLVKYGRVIPKASACYGDRCLIFEIP